MRFINVYTLELEEYGTFNPPYVIISHRWHDEEFEYQHYKALSPFDRDSLLREPWAVSCEKRPAMDKVAWAIATVREHYKGINYMWIDTCCVDKGDPTEIERCVNSMFRLYQEAEVCLAYLRDVDAVEHDKERIRQLFIASEWFKRGWTLQELIAPREVNFYDREWNMFGTRSSMVHDIYAASRIEPRYLLGEWEEACVAVKFHWLSGRTTTYSEDMAYCMAGLLQINIDRRPGEEERAFTRLQEKLLQELPDESIFAWNMPPSILSWLPEASWGILAPWPSCFSESGQVTIEHGKNEARSPFQVRNRGVCSRFRGVCGQYHEQTLNCWVPDPKTGCIKRISIRLEKNAKGMWRRIGTDNWRFERSKTRSLCAPWRLASNIKVAKMHVPHRVPGETDLARLLSLPCDPELAMKSLDSRSTGLTCSL